MYFVSNLVYLPTTFFNQIKFCFSVVLISKEDNENVVTIVMKQHIKDIAILDQPGVEIGAVNSADLFSHNSQVTSSQGHSREYIIDWLNKSQVPFTEVNEAIEVEGVRINPPFNAASCISSNPTKLARVQQLLHNLSSKE